METILNKISKFWKESILPFLRDPLFLSRWILPYRRENESNRISVRVGSGGYRWIGHDYRGDIFMFVQDMYQDIMPFTHVRGKESQFVVRTEPESYALADIIAKALSQSGYRHSLSEALCEFIRKTTHSLFIYGRAAYEIVYERDAKGRITSFEFMDICPLSLKRIFGSYFQIIPWWIAKHSHVKVGIKRIPNHKMLFIEFPKELGGRRTLKKILKRLSVLGREIIPGFQMEAMKTHQNIGFDIEEYTRTKYLEKAQLTKHLGWHQRKIPDDEILEYYSLYRHLRFSLSQAIIREHILDLINKALNGKVLNLGVKVVMQGIPTAEQIKAEFKTLRDGNLEFVKLYERTNI